VVIERTESSRLALSVLTGVHSFSELLVLIVFLLMVFGYINYNLTPLSRLVVDLVKKKRRFSMPIRDITQNVSSR